MDKFPVTPQWIAKMYAGNKGRDHLGLGSVSADQILPSLSPSINVLTFHPRYHSFYVFLLDEYWRRERPRNRKNWIAFYRPREFIYSVGVYLCDQEEHGDMHSVVGGQKTGPLASENRETYKSNVDYIKSELGGYGLYYRTVMAELGLLYPGGRGYPYPVDLPTKFGKEVAKSFRDAVSDTAYYSEYFDKDNTAVPKEVVEEYIRKACLCQLKVPDAPDRPLLLDIFLNKGSKPESRRQTFRLFLDLADQTVDFSLEEDQFRQLIYFQDTLEGLSYSPREGVNEIYIKWRLYQAREYYSFALNALWYYLCDWGIAQGGNIQPIPLSVLWKHLEEVFHLGGVSDRFNLHSAELTINNRYRDLMDWLTEVALGNEATLSHRFDINRPIHEHHLYRWALENKSSPDAMVVGMILMLTLIALRFGNRQFWQRSEWKVSKMGENGRCSVDRFIKSLYRRLENGQPTIREIVEWIFREYIILQHQIIATSKFPDNTFRFRRQGNKLEFINFSNPLGFMNSRFDSISTTVFELGLYGDLSKPDHKLTPDGEVLLKQGNL